MQGFIHYSIYPTFLVLFVFPIFALYDRLSIQELQLLSLVSIAGAVALAFILEIIIPFDRQFKMFSKQFIWDSYFTFIQLPVISLVIDTIGKALKSAHIPTLGFIWPHHINAILQTFLILLIAELFYFTYHYIGHRSEFVWRFHKYHHQFPTVYWNNSATFHIADIFLSAFFYFLPLLIFSVSPQVQYLFITLSGVTGILIHVNFQHNTSYLNKLFNTAELHRWHHQSQSNYKNFGKVLCVWDWAFQTRFEKENNEILKAYDDSAKSK